MCAPEEWTKNCTPIDSKVFQKRPPMLMRKKNLPALIKSPMHVWILQLRPEASAANFGKRYLARMMPVALLLL